MKIDPTKVIAQPVVDRGASKGIQREAELAHKDSSGTRVEIASETFLKAQQRTERIELLKERYLEGSLSVEPKAIATHMLNVEEA